MEDDIECKDGNCYFSLGESDDEEEQTKQDTDSK